MKLDALFFAAHPDDAELCCGGTIRKFTKSGKKIGIIDLTNGELSTRGSVSLRKRETFIASKILGISIRENLLISDGNIENSQINRLKVISAIRNYKPKVIFIPHYFDRHPDHTNTNILVKEAAFYSGLEKIATVHNSIKQKPHRAVRNIYYMQTYSFEPSFIIDISDEFTDKLKAIKAYSSQFYNPKSRAKETFISSKSFLEFTEARAKLFGFQINAAYGEAFYIEEKIKLETFNIFS